MRRVNPFSFALVGLICVVASVRAENAPLPDLRDLDVKNWDCLEKERGTARSAADAARNRMKNRRWVDATNSVPRWTFDQFVKNARQFDAEVGAPSRKSLTPAQADRLAEIEHQTVSVTGWIVLAYPGPKDSSNCGSVDYHDWYIELLPDPLDRVPHPGDPTAIICEVTPRTEAKIYQAGVRLQKLAAFIRTGEPPNLEPLPTGSEAHKVRITGYLLWDDQHNQPKKDIGTTIATGGGREYHHPWRVTAWEIHPVLKIEDLGTAH